MEAYYRDGSCTIYNADAAEFLDAQGSARADLVVTDPPYGIGTWSSTGGNSITADEAAAMNRWDTRPDDALIRATVNAGRYAVVWGGNYFADVLGPCRSPLVWDKQIRGMHFADGEFAWTNFDFGTLRIFTKSPRQGVREHPTQKPAALMRWCIGLVPDVATVLDPFMGSGSTLRAAKDLGRRAVGVEVEEAYCEIAARRLAQEVLAL